MPKANVLVRHLDSQPGLDVLGIGAGRFERIVSNATGRHLLDKCRGLFTVTAVCRQNVADPPGGSSGTPVDMPGVDYVIRMHIMHM